MLKRLLSAISSIAPDERAYALVAQEIASGQIRAGLWAKALAESDYDERRAKARYMKLRALAVAEERQVEAAQLESLRRNQEQAERDEFYAEQARERVANEEAARLELTKADAERRLKKVRRFLKDPVTAEDYAMELGVGLGEVERLLGRGDISGYVLGSTLYVDRPKR